MITFAYSVYDNKVGTFSQPFFAVHVQVAVRSIIAVAHDLDTTIGRHPADYALYQVGEFDDQTGELRPCHPLSIGTVLSMLPPTPAPGPLFTKGE